MRAHLIGVNPPGLDQDLSLPKRVEDLPIQQVVSRLRVEALAAPVLPGARLRDAGRLSADRSNPVLHGLGHKLRPLIPSGEIVSSGVRFLFGITASAVQTRLSFGARQRGQTITCQGYMMPLHTAKLEVRDGISLCIDEHPMRFHSNSVATTLCLRPSRSDGWHLSIRLSHKRQRACP